MLLTTSTNQYTCHYQTFILFVYIMFLSNLYTVFFSLSIERQNKNLFHIFDTCNSYHMWNVRWIKGLHTKHMIKADDTRKKANQTKLNGKQILFVWIQKYFSYFLFLSFYSSLILHVCMSIGLNSKLVFVLIETSSKLCRLFIPILSNQCCCTFGCSFFHSYQTYSTFELWKSVGQKPHHT